MFSISIAAPKLLPPGQAQTSITVCPGFASRSLTAVCDARKGSFDAKEILNAVAVVYKRPENPLEKKLKELEKHEKTKNNLAEELAKIKEELEKAKKEIEKLLKNQ